MDYISTCKDDEQIDNLLKMAFDKNAVIITYHEHRVKKLEDRAKELELEIQKPIVISRFTLITQSDKLTMSAVVIDNIDRLLLELLGASAKIDNVNTGEDVISREDFSTYKRKEFREVKPEILQISKETSEELKNVLLSRLRLYGRRFG